MISSSNAAQDLNTVQPDGSGGRSLQRPTDGLLVTWTLGACQPPTQHF